MKRFLILGALIAGAMIADEPELVAQPKKTPNLAAEAKFEIKQRIRCMAFSPDGKFLAVAEDNVHLYDVSGEAPKEIGVLKSKIGLGIRSIAFSPDGKKLAFGGADNTVRVWDVASQTEVTQVKEHKGDVRSVAFSPDGKMLATGSNDRTVFLWDVADDGKLTEKAVVKAADKDASAISSVAFAQKGKVLVTAGTNGALRTYSIDKTVKQTGLLKAKESFSDATVFSSPDGKMWGITNRKEVYLMTATGVGAGSLVGHKENVVDAAYSPDGKLIASAGRDGTLHVWTLATKMPKITKERPSKFTSVAWAPAADGADQLLAASLEDGTVWLMRIEYK